MRGLVGASFLLGMALVLFYGSANAVFLTRYDITVLPWVYMVNAGVVIAVGLGYGAWSARVPVATALAGLAVMMTVSVAVLWVWATLSDDGVVAFVMATWFRLLFIFAVLGLWEIASAVFDIRQAKRLFAAVALGLMLAFVVGGLATPVLSTLIGTVNLVGAAAACFALYTVDFRRLLRRHRIGQRHAMSAAPAGPAEILADRYSRRMVWMKYVTILLLYVSEYVFYEQAAATFETEASLAGFLGSFMGAMTVVMVLVTGLVSGRFISRFGIRAATLALPVGMVLVAVPTGLYGSLVAIDTLFFALVCLVLATDHVVGNAIGEPAGAVLFQPMPAVRRMRVRLAVDGWLGSVALAFAGVLLLVFNALDLDTVAPFLFLVAAIAAVGVVIAILQYRDYVRALRTVTTLAFADDGDAAHVARDARDALDTQHIADALAADDPGSVVATVALMRELRADPLRPLLPALVSHTDPDVVVLALESIAAGGDQRDADLADAALDRTDLPDTARATALTTLAVLDPVRGRSRTAAMLSGPAPAIAIGTALGDVSLRSSALDRLARLASGDTADRLAACRVIGLSDGAADEVAPVLDALLRDADDSVVDAALDATARRGCPDVARSAVELVRSPAHQRRAIRALAAIGASAVGAIDEVVGELPDEVVADVVRDVVGPHVDAATVRRCFLARGTPSVVRTAAYQVLAPGAAVRDELAMELDLVASITAAHRDLAGSAAAPSVADALGEELELARRSIYAALGVEYGARRLRDIEVLVRAGDEDDRANAIEALDVVLAPDHRRAIIAALEPVGLAEAAGSLPNLPPARPARDWCGDLRDDPRLTTWTRVVAAAQLDHRTDGAPPMDPTISRVLSLRHVDIFSTLSSDSLIELARLVRAQSVSAGTVLIETGAPGEELYAITDGVVEATTSRGHVSRIEAGGVVGELAILDPAPRSATVVAVTDVDLLVVSRATLLALADRRPAVMTEIARVLARRLRDAT